MPGIIKTTIEESKNEGKLSTLVPCSRDPETTIYDPIIHHGAPQV